MKTLFQYFCTTFQHSKGSILLILLLGIFSTSFIGIHGKSQADQGWELVKSEAGIKVYTKKTKIGFKAIKMTTSIATDLASFKAFVNDAAKYPDWVYRCIKSTIIEQTETTISYQTVTDMPFPLEDRVVLISSKQEQNGNQWSSFSEGLPIENVPSNLTHIPFYESSWEVIQVEENKIEIAYELRMNPGGYIPEWMYNFGLEMGPTTTLQNLRDNLEGKSKAKKKK